MTTLRCAIEDWHSYRRHEIVSLYFLMMEKIQQEAVPATFHVNDEAHLPLPQPTAGRQRSMSITIQPKDQDTNIPVVPSFQLQGVIHFRKMNKGCQ